MTDDELQKAAQENKELVACAENPGEVVRLIFRNADLVYGLFPSESGFGRYIIKGRRLLQSASSATKVTAFPCQDLEGAKVLANLFGDASDT